MHRLIMNEAVPSKQTLLRISVFFGCSRNGLVSDYHKSIPFFYFSLLFWFSDHFFSFRKKSTTQFYICTVCARIRSVSIRLVFFFLLSCFDARVEREKCTHTLDRSRASERAIEWAREGGQYIHQLVVQLS